MFTFYFPDDFGNADRELIGRHGSMVQMIRFYFDGCYIEGINEGLIEGEADEEAMRYFGLIL